MDIRGDLLLHDEITREVSELLVLFVRYCCFLFELLTSLFMRSEEEYSRLPYFLHKWIRKCLVVQ